MRAPVVWADAIGQVSATFMNATISLLDPSLVTSDYDAETATNAQTGNPVIESGIAARVQQIRPQSDVAGRAISNPSGDVRMRVQIPRTAYTGRIKRGWQILVTSADRNPELTGYVFVVDAVVNSGWRASITIECAANVETEADWTLP